MGKLPRAAVDSNGTPTAWRGTRDCDWQAPQSWGKWQRKGAQPSSWACSSETTKARLRLRPPMAARQSARRRRSSSRGMLGRQAWSTSQKFPCRERKRGETYNCVAVRMPLYLMAAAPGPARPSSASGVRTKAPRKAAAQSAGSLGLCMATPCSTKTEACQG